LIPRIEGVESVVDATGQPEAGARIALDAFEHRKNLVMMNVEGDVTIGPVLRRRAEKAGVIYSMAAGDEPTALMELYDFAKALGLEIVAAGKGKNNPLNRDATPEQYEAEARRRGLNPMMLVEFVDGSKTMIEMACFANATGLTPDVPNMHGPNTSVPELNQVFRLKSDGGILHRKGVVDYAVGRVAPGVFLIVATDHPRLKQCLVLRDMGQGPAYTLFRPFHLCSMEVPLTVATIGLYGRSTMQPLDQLSAEVTTIAKRDLAPGELLEGIGGRTHHAGCMAYPQARDADALPIGLAKGCKVGQAIPKGTLITRSMVEVVSGSILHKLRAEQDAFSEALV
jgi:predicted homoserine dehydrogenase-like protein